MTLLWRPHRRTPLKIFWLRTYTCLAFSFDHSIARSKRAASAPVVARICAPASRVAGRVVELNVAMIERATRRALSSSSIFSPSWSIQIQFCVTSPSAVPSSSHCASSRMRQTGNRFGRTDDLHMPKRWCNSFRSRRTFVEFGQRNNHIDEQFSL